MRSPNHPDEHDLDVALMRRTPPQMTSVKNGHGGRHGKKGIGRYLVGGLVALVLALFSGVIWFAYQDLMPGGDEAPPMIRADATPIKREPDERGGLPLLNDESAVVQGLDEPDSPVRVERIMPRESTAPRSTADVIPEALEAEPRSDADLAASDLAASDPALGDRDLVMAEAGLGSTTDAGSGGEAATGDSLDTLLAEIVDGQEALSTIEPAAGSPVSDSVAPDPGGLDSGGLGSGGSDTAALDDVLQPADGLALPESDVAATASPSAIATAATTSVTTAPAASVAAPAASPATTQSTPAPAPGSTQGPATTTAAASPATSPAPAAPVATPRAAAPAETAVAALPSPALAENFVGAYGVQLLAVRDEEAAAGAWTGLQQQHPAVLGPLRSRVQRADISGNTFYRLQAGPFAERAGANAVCAALQARGMDCFIVEPTS